MVRKSLWLQRILLSLACFIGVSQLLAQQPNILLIQCDDLGFEDIGINNSFGLLKTPNIDALAGESAQFENFYVNPLCALSRASLLTGRHHFKVGVFGVQSATDYVNLDEVMISETLQQNGYRTGFMGKWHSGKGGGYYPWHRGFDEAYMADNYIYTDNRFNHNGTIEKKEGWVESAMADLAIDFIESVETQPFFLYYSPFTGHKGFLTGADRSSRMIRSKWHAPETLYNYYLDEMNSIAGFPGSNEQKSELANLYGAISQLDQDLGRIFTRIDELGIRENTLIILLSDNGPAVAWSFEPDSLIWDMVRCPSGMRGNKSQILENGIRSFCLINYGSNLTPSTLSNNATIEDIYPTILEVADIGSSGGKQLDGKSLRSLLKTSAWEHDDRYIYSTLTDVDNLYYTDVYDVNENNEVVKPQSKLVFDYWYSAIRQGDYKFYRDSLFNINADEHIEETIYSDPIAADLKAEMSRWWEEVMDEAGSFERPVFQIGWDGDSISLVRMFSVLRKSPALCLGRGFLTGFKEGDFSSTKINVVTPGFYRPSLRIDSISPGFIGLFRLSTKSDTVESTRIENSKLIFPSLELNANDEEIKLELVEILSFETFDKMNVTTLTLAFQGLACPSPDGVGISLLQGETAYVDWNEVASVFGYEVKLSSEFSVDSTFVTESTGLSINPFLANEVYNLSVRSICPFDTSAYTQVQLQDPGSFTISPNPSAGVFQIDLRGAFPEAELSLFDQSGRAIFELVPYIEDNRIKLQLLDLDQGVYIIQIRNERATIAEKLVISK